MNEVRDLGDVRLRDPPMALPKTLSLASLIKELRNKIASLRKQCVELSRRPSNFGNGPAP
jgi:hypothetical protein